MNPESRNGPSAVAQIAEVVKAAVAGLPGERIRELVRSHLVQLRLIDKAGAWRARELERLSECLLCGDVDREEVCRFVDHVARCVEANPYLMDFLERARSRTFPRLYSKVRAEGALVLPCVVSYAIVLERLTKAMREGWTIVEACRKVWQKARARIGPRNYVTFFEQVKFASVDMAIGRCLACHRSGKVPPAFSSVMLPVNVLEAMLEDLRLGNRDNALAGWPLALNRPGARRLHVRTGAGPSRWSEDKKAILFSMPLPTQWAALYSTWNLAFVSHYGDFPYLMAKLLIPQVNGYQDSPEEYIYNRVLALYTQMVHTALGRVDLAREGKGAVDWSDAELTKFWSEVNRINARDYSEVVRRLGPGRFFRCRTVW